jgi:hypothetical protein
MYSMPQTQAWKPLVRTDKQCNAEDQFIPEIAQTAYTWGERPR